MFSLKLYGYNFFKRSHLSKCCLLVQFRANFKKLREGVGVNWPHHSAPPNHSKGASKNKKTILSLINLSYLLPLANLGLLVAI